MTSSSIPSTKVCTKCGQELPATTEYFHKHKAGKCGLRPTCKNCRRENYYANHERELNRHRRWLANNREHCRQYRRDYYAENRDRELEYFGNRYRQNAEHYRELSRQWRIKNPDKKREQYQRWLENNPDYYRERYRNNRKHIKQLGRQWRMTNPDKRRAIQSRYRARKRNSDGTHSDQDIQRQYKQQNGRCYWCDVLLDSNDYHVDHVIPISRGGGNGPDNLVCACPSCNLSKGNKMPWEWEGTDKLI